MLHKKSKKPKKAQKDKKAKKAERDRGDLIRASVENEMARPRMARSARIAERNLDMARVPERTSTTMPGTVNKFIESPLRRQPEKARIAFGRASQLHGDLRIENSLTDENGDDVNLKKGAHVDVTVAAEGKTSAAKNVKES
jgi:hypothetical protein